MIFTFQMIVAGIINIAANGLTYFLSENFLMIIFFFIYLLFTIWILTATFLPIIKINNDGIFAYSIFWKRNIKWEEIKSTKLLKVKNTRSSGLFGGASISFELAQEPETKNNALTNKGVRVNTFIVISKSIFKKPSQLSLSGQLLTHNKIATIEEIAFEYEQKAWQNIQNKSTR